MFIADLETPAIVVDLDVLERNLSRMADYCRSHNLRLRPHTKSHKIPELAKRQLAHAAQGITVAKIGEAEVMLDAGIDDILIAYPIVGADKVKRLATIAERATIAVSLDSEAAAIAISSGALFGLRPAIGAPQLLQRRYPYANSSACISPVNRECLASRWR